MDKYKKKPLKFIKEVRKEIRHAETVKARESSRFKRLSMLRNLDEDLEQSSFEKSSEEVKKPVSRVEILRKWKHEKLVQKQLEKKQSIRPFYAGVSSLITNKGTSKIGKCNQSARDMSSISKKVPSCNSNLVSRVPSTSKQVSSCIPNQFSRIPNSSKQVSSCNSVPTSRIPNSSKQLGAIPKSTKPQLPRIPSSDQALAKKPIVFSNNLKTNKVLLKSKVQPGISSQASSLNGSSSTKGFQSRIGAFSPASSLNGSGSTKGFQTGIPVSAVPRRIPVQSKLPVTSSQKQIAASNKKLPPVPSVGSKLPAVSSFQKSNPGLVKKPGLVSKIELKKAPPVLGNQKQGKKAFPTSTATTRKEPSEVEKVIPKEKGDEPACSVDNKSESGSERNNESLSDVFDCDVSIIKRAPSFAPENFKFQPPSEILDFSFDISILNKIKEFTSRTSTPTKQYVAETKSEEDVKEVTQKLSENEAIETQISTPPKQPAVKNKDVEEIFQRPTEYLEVDVKTNISTPSKLHIVIHKCYKDEETMHKPSESADIEDNIIASNPVQDCKSNEDDNEIMQRSSENVKIESNNSSPSEDLAQGSEKYPLKINLQDSCDSSQPVCDNSASPDEEIPLKDLEKVVAETEDVILPSNREIKVKNKKNIPLSAYQIAFQKRRSILKNSTLNSIAEADDDLFISPVNNAAENKENILRKTPRCSRRFSNLISIDESPSTTPRRSSRISKLISIDESPSTTPRRSLRLQEKVPKNNQLDDLNPKGSSHTNLTNDFDQLTLEDFDKMDPEDYLFDFDDSPQKIKSKKISLLYSPDKRQSIRRSIRGDLMSFSPNNSPRV